MLPDCTLCVVVRKPRPCQKRQGCCLAATYPTAVRQALMEFVAASVSLGAVLANLQAGFSPIVPEDARDFTDS